MKFNLSTSKEDSLYHDALGLLGISESDTTTLPIATFTRYANAWYRRMVYRIWRSSGQWQFDDSNHTDLPEATTTLVNAQDNYTIPTTALDVLECYAMNANGDYVKLQKLNTNQLDYARDEFCETDGMPVYWYLQGNSIRLKPAPATGYVTMAAGMKVIFDRDIDGFAITDTSQEPGLPAFTHRVLSLGGSYDFARSRGMTLALQTIKPDLDLMLQEVEDYTSKRSRTDNPPAVTPSSRVYI